MNAMMHICVIANIESIHTKRMLKNMASRGHRVDVIGFDKAEVEGVTVHCIMTPSILKSRGLRYLYCIFPARKLVKKLKPDILLSIYFIGPGALGATCNYHPYVVMAIGSDVLLKMERSFLYSLITKFIIKRAVRFISVSEVITDKLIKRGVQREHILTNPIGVDTNVFSCSDISDKKQKIQIVSTRRLEPVYNVKQFVDSLSILFQKRKDFDVVIIGTGSEYKSIKRSIDKYHLDENVKFLEDVKLSTLVETLKKSLLFVSMSLSDGAPVSLFEAMSCGCFPIVSDIPANRKWIQNGINGYLVPLCDHEMLAKRISEAMNNSLLLNDAKLINRKLVEERLEFSKSMDNLIKYLNSISKMNS